MTITERLFEIANKKNIKQADLANALGIKAQLVNNWKTRGTTPPMEYLPSICKTLNVSWEYLVTGQETTSAQHLTYDEEYLLKNYRLASDKGRGRIQECAREMVKLYPYIDAYKIAKSVHKQIHTNVKTEKLSTPIKVIKVTRKPGGQSRLGAVSKRKPNTEVAKYTNPTDTKEQE